MNDITFIFPIRIDSDERLENINTNIDYLKKLFNPSIIIAEDRTNLINRNDIIKINTNFNDLFYKTRIINNAVKNSITDFIAVIDADLIFGKEDYEEAYYKIKNNDYDIIFGYNGKCWNYSRNLINIIKNNIIIRGENFLDHRLECMNDNAVGGSIWCSKNVFFEIGGQNEKMISWGYEDNEFYERFLKLEKRFYRTSGETYHLSHSRGIDSSWNNPHINHNLIEYQRIQRMNKHELINEINNWNWNK